MPDKETSNELTRLLQIAGWQLDPETGQRTWITATANGHQITLSQKAGFEDHCSYVDSNDKLHPGQGAADLAGLLASFAADSQRHLQEEERRLRGRKS
jgi:hypothetical protein